MNSLLDLIRKLNNSNIKIKVIDEELKIKAPKGKLTNTLLEEIRLRKVELIRFYKKNDAFSKIEIREKKEFYPLSSAQKRLYLLQQLDLESTAYNMPYTIRLGTDFDKKRIEWTFKQLISRHETFRTSFHFEGKEPVQRIHDSVDFKIEEFNITKSEVEDIQHNIKQPFDLSKAPLLRVILVNVEDGGNLLMIDMLHIICDGTSQGILGREFQRLYSGEDLEPLRLQYKDFSEWQNCTEQQEKIKSQEEYWLDKFDGELPVMTLPTDYTRPAIQSFEGARVSFTLSKEETKKLKNLAKEKGLTLYMSILSVLNILLYKLSGQEDIVIGTPIAGRKHIDLENIVGMFVNTIPIRNKVNSNESVSDFVSNLKQVTIEAFDNQDYQFEDLVEKVSVERDMGRNPLFGVMFNLLNQTEYSGDLSGFNNQELVHTRGTSKFDLNLTGFDFGNQILLNIEYSTKLFNSETINRFIGYFRTVLDSICDHDSAKIKDIEILTASERELILEGGMGVLDPVDLTATIHGLFEDVVTSNKDKIALRFGDKQLSYGCLNERSNQLAHMLRNKGVTTDHVVGVMQDRSLELIISIFGILKSGGAYLPIDTEYPVDRISYMLTDGGISILLTDQGQEMLNEIQAENVEIFDIHSLLLDNEPKDNLPLSNKGNDLIYLIYTSGSTGRPKGVMLEHQNMVNLLYHDFRHTNIDFSSVLQFSTISFDASAHEIFGALLYAGELVLGNKDDLLNITRFYRMIDRDKVATVFLPMSMLRVIFGDSGFISQFPQCVNHIQTAGEQVMINENFRKFLHERGVFLHNHYGPSETHVVTTLSLSPDKEIPELPSIGRPIINTECILLDSHGSLVAHGVVGELCIGGLQLGRGYIGNEELTSEKFIEHPLKLGERLYRTGDLARWLFDGNIEFLGRIDLQVKIRGYRIEPGEIERILLSQEHVKDCVVQALSNTNGEKYLCAYIIRDTEELTDSLIRNYLDVQLPNYMIPQYIVFLDKFPVTKNGKLDRRALPIPDVKAGEDYIAPSNETEEKLVEIWSDVLIVAKEEISANANFFAIGGHSLKATILANKIHKEFSVDYPLRDIFRNPTIKLQGKQIDESARKEFVSIPKAKPKDYYILSSAQKRLYVLQQFDLESTAYNMPYTIRLGEDFDKDRIELTFKQLILRHETLRTSFHLKGEEIVQCIHEKVDFRIDELRIENSEKNTVRDQFIKPFNLSQAPLLRVSLVKVQNGVNLLMIDMHHIISDGVSHAILEQDFQALYSGEVLEPLRLQYKDYSEWQDSAEQQEKIKDQKSYWLEKFIGEIPVLALPTDFVRPAKQSFEGAIVSFAVCKEDTQSLKNFSKENRLTLYMSLISVFSILLSKLSRQDDIVIGTPIAGRKHADLENVVGVFINTLTIRNEVNGSESLRNFVAKIKQVTLEAFENQDYQFEDLVEKVSVERDIGHNPIFDVMFNLLNQSEYEGDLSNIDTQDYIHNPGVSKFDLTLTAVDYGEQLLLTFEYCTKLFSVESINRLIGYLKRIIRQMSDKLDSNICDIELLNEKEKVQLLHEFNDTGKEYPSGKTISQLFEEQVEKTPHNIAATCGNDEINYLDLFERSNKVANYLLKNCENNSLIGIMTDRSIDMVSGILGVLKSGNAYLPLDVKHPQNRIRRILQESSTNILLTNIGDIVQEGVRVVNLRSSDITKESTVNTCDKVESTSPAYVIYTSGSTGAPKGVMISHRNLVNFVSGMRAEIFTEESKSFLSLTTISFDIFGLELYIPLLMGSKVVLVKDEDHFEVKEILSIVQEQEVNALQLTPSRLNLFLSAPESKGIFDQIDTLLVGGEEFPLSLLTEIRDHYQGKIYNMYGPTETTIWSTYKDVSGILPLNIGQPIINTQIYILGLNNELQPIGVAGELCISGDGLAQGYINNPELTKEKFVVHPSKAGERLYRTGDLARWLPDGNIEFLGRLDHQVKIRGFRIELGEIENVLQSHENIKESVVLAREDKEDKYLCAYIVKESDLNLKDLRIYLSNALPDYMIPSYFVEIEKIPLTSSGKVNRKALPAPEIKAGDDYVAPSNEIEEKVVKIWSRILNLDIEKISLNKSFFELGGNSLKIIQMTSILTNDLKWEVSITDLFTYTTITSLIDFVNNDKMNIDSVKDKEEVVEMESLINFLSE